MGNNLTIKLLSDDNRLQKSIVAHLDGAGMQCQLSESKLADVIKDPGLIGLVVDSRRIFHCQEHFLSWLALPGRRAPTLLLASPEHVDLASDCIDAGLDYYLRQPVGENELRATLSRLRRQAGARASVEVTASDAVRLESPAMQAVYSRLQSVAPLDALNILLSGETGTGKQEVARLVHQLSRRSSGPFAEVDCAALPANLVESELFGHEAGAYTDARQRQAGLLETAQKGTLFLDEIGELPLEAQAKLLRALEHRRFRRVGGREEVSLDVRLVSASNRDLAEEVRQGRFRADLYYRLNGVGLHLLPLRERLEDMEHLAEKFYAWASALFGREAMPLSPAVLQVLREHAWPGNIRELKSVMYRVVALCPAGMPLDAGHLAHELLTIRQNPALVAVPGVPSLREVEADLVRRALKASGGNKTAAARMMGVSKPTYFRMIKSFGIKD